jgi:hypothetical protein
MELFEHNYRSQEDNQQLEICCEVSDSFIPLHIIYGGLIYPYELKKCCKKYKKGKRCKKCPDN